MLTPFFAFPHSADAAGLADSFFGDAFGGSSGTGSAVSGLDPNTVAVLTPLRDFFHRPAVFFSAGSAAAASPPALNAVAPGTAFAPVIRMALTCSFVARFHLLSLLPAAAAGAASPSAGGGASASGSAIARERATGDGPSARARVSRRGRESPVPRRNRPILSRRERGTISEDGSGRKIVPPGETGYIWHFPKTKTPRRRRRRPARSFHRRRLRSERADARAIAGHLDTRFGRDGASLRRMDDVY